MTDQRDTLAFDPAAATVSDYIANFNNIERTPNVPLIRKTLEHITAHPEEWDQTTWATERQGCGTAFCFAGHVVNSEGHEIVWESGGECDCEWCGGTVSAEFCLVDGKPRTISNVAMHALGLTRDQADTLFAGGNGLQVLYALANEYTNGEIEIPADVKARSGT